MTYFKVKKEYDNKRRKGNTILVANELYTKKEVEKYEIPTAYLQEVNINKKNVCFVFGARFEIK